jgi:hypothetical protein
MSEIRPCYRCGKVPDLDPNGGYPTVACSDCYDGAPDSGTRSEIGSGMNAAQAIADWNEKMEQEIGFDTPLIAGRPVGHPPSCKCSRCDAYNQTRSGT